MDKDEKAKFLARHQSLLVPHEPLEEVMDRERALGQVTHGWWITMVSQVIPGPPTGELVAQEQLELMSQLEDTVLDAMREN